MEPAELRYIGRVESELRDLKECPKQGYEGAPTARVVIEPAYRDALLRIKPGSRIVLLTWFHQADRTVLQVHPRNDSQKPLTGVFLTRAPVRPNPIGIHEVQVVAINEEGVLTVEPLEALDGTPVIDIKLSIPRRYH